jgi:carboxypeptidase C (cathepsin A)
VRDVTSGDAQPNDPASPSRAGHPDDAGRTDDARDRAGGPAVRDTHEYRPPAGSEVAETWTGPDGTALECTTRAEWLVLRERDEPVAEVFSVATVAREGGADRPVTFVFNGGPGASSAYLNVGAVGPRRVAFTPDGRVLPPPTRLTDNAESWLAFSDLVFVDPVGTGFSRVVERGRARPGGGDPGPGAAGAGTEAGGGGAGGPGGAGGSDANAFFGLKRDLESLGEFMVRWLSRYDRWASPVFVAGESYGGFRVAKLVRLLTETYGIGLNGAVLVSPALELALLDPSDYDVLPWVDMLPTMAAAAAFHGRSRAFPADAALEEVLAAAEEFATGPYATFLTRGAALPADERAAVLARQAELVGLPEARTRLAEGRIGIAAFARELRRDEGQVLALYDASVSARDPFPDRDAFAGPDPSLAGIEHVFTAGINARLRTEVGVRTERQYHLLSHEVNKAWKIDLEKHALESQVGATDDLRYGMSLNPHLRVFLTHGYYDLVTPYYASNRLRNLMRLDPETAGRVTVRHFPGGHMFYAWERSRVAFRDAMAEFYGRSLPTG